MPLARGPSARARASAVNPSWLTVSTEAPASSSLATTVAVLAGRESYGSRGPAACSTAFRERDAKGKAGGEGGGSAEVAALTRGLDCLSRQFSGQV